MLWWCGVLAVNVVLLIAGTELVCRVMLPASGQAVHMSPEFIHDPVLGWKGQPGFRGRYQLTGSFISINGDGFRDADWGEKIARAERGKLTRVLFIGDSTTYGYEIEANCRIGEQLAWLYGKGGREIECFNAGIAAFGPDQAWLALQAVAPTTDPDVVVFRYCVNDTGDAALPFCWATPEFRVYRPYFDTRGNQILNRPVPMRFSLRMKERGLGWLRLWRLVDMVEKKVDDARYRRKGIAPNRRLAMAPEEVGSGNRHVWDMGCLGVHPGFDDLYESNKERVFSILRHMDSFCKARGARFLVGTDTAAGEDPSEAVSDLRKMLADAGIPLVDLQEGNRYGQWSWVAMDGHPNAIANYYAAGNLYRAIEGTNVPAVCMADADWYKGLMPELPLYTSQAHSQLFGEGWSLPLEHDGLKGRWLRGCGQFMLPAPASTSWCLRAKGIVDGTTAVLTVSGMRHAPGTAIGVTGRFDVVMTPAVDASDGMMFCVVSSTVPVFLEMLGIGE